MGLPHYWFCVSDLSLTSRSRLVCWWHVTRNRWGLMSRGAYNTYWLCVSVLSLTSRSRLVCWWRVTRNRRIVHFGTNDATNQPHFPPNQPATAWVTCFHYNWENLDLPKRVQHNGRCYVCDVQNRMDAFQPTNCWRNNQIVNRKFRPIMHSLRHERGRTVPWGAIVMRSIGW